MAPGNSGSPERLHGRAQDRCFFVLVKMPRAGSQVGQTSDITLSRLLRPVNPNSVFTPSCLGINYVATSPCCDNCTEQHINDTSMTHHCSLSVGKVADFFDLGSEK